MVSGEQEAMIWADEIRGDILVAKPKGRIDESTAQAFADGLAESVDRAATVATRKLVLDCAGVDYMSSRGLRALTLAKRKADGAGVSIALAAPNEVMREILAISRYDKLFAVTDTVDAAL
jgi:anti-sigma B factor antagonist